jgi:hypothetical protein
MDVILVLQLPHPLLGLWLLVLAGRVPFMRALSTQLTRFSLKTILISLLTAPRRSGLCQVTSLPKQPDHLVRV